MLGLARFADKIWTVGLTISWWIVHLRSQVFSLLRRLSHSNYWRYCEAPLTVEASCHAYSFPTINSASLISSTITQLGNGPVDCWCLHSFVYRETLTSHWISDVKADVSALTLCWTKSCLTLITTILETFWWISFLQYLPTSVRLILFIHRVELFWQFIFTRKTGFTNGFREAV